MSETPATDDQPVDCTLDGDEMTARESWIEAEVVPHLDDVAEREDGYTLVFERTAAAYEAVTELAWREADCCSWATIAVELPPGGEQLRWRIVSGREGGTEFLDAVLADVAERIDGLAP